jgi:uncharacterized membrane protein
MQHSNQQIQDLLRRIEQLNYQNLAIKNTIKLLNDEVNELAFKINNADAQSEIIEEVEEPKTLPFVSEVKRIETPIKGQFRPNSHSEFKPLEAEVEKKGTPQYMTSLRHPDSSSGNPNFEVSKSLEAFIGENLASKVGIIITVLGVSIGVKYAIDNDLISHWGRIILGYLAGCGLLEASFRLRRKDEKYENLSNIILSGGFASVFFVTYAAYSFYGLMPQTVAFALMVLIAGLTVAAALKYDQELIAVGGLVGAYTVPFLLSTGADKPITLFTYMAIINVGILFISFKKDWRLLFYLSFVVTWLVFIGWINGNNNYEKTAIAGTFLTTFFAIFYTIFMAYKFIKNEANFVEQTLIFLLNSAFFYGFGYLILDNNLVGKHYLGVFTLFNALVHLVVSKYVFERDLADKNLFNLLSSFVVFFVTMTIWVQFDGIYVTLLWAAEMIVLFLIGRYKKLFIYENATYISWFLSSFNLVHNWSEGGYFNSILNTNAVSNLPILNPYFFTTLIVIAADIFILKMLHQTDIDSNNSNENNGSLFIWLSRFFVFFITVSIGVLFNGTTVTLLWAAEMCLFFWLGRSKNIPIFADSTYSLWILTIFSLVQDWSAGHYLHESYWQEAVAIPSVLNIYFLSTALVIAAFLFIRYVHLKPEYAVESEENKVNYPLISVLLTIIILGLFYALFFNEINNYFNQQNVVNYLKLHDMVDENIERFRTVWLINYSLLFVGILQLMNLKKYQDSDFAKVVSILSLLTIFGFLTSGLYTLGELKNAYLYHEQAEFFHRGIGSGLLLRYLSYALVGGVFYLLHQTKNAFFRDDEDVQKGFELIVSATLLWILSSEMVHWLELNGYTQAYKWAISVLFGLFAFGLIGYGISEKKNKKHLRIAAIGLFILTLIKVFAFDLIGLDTIAKTIVMVSLGILLLLISYLYTKFKDTLLGDEK